MTDTANPVRKHDLPGLYNFRDTGGYAAATGTSRWGKLFRSDALHRIDDHGRAALSDLGINHVIDLRGDTERRTAPSRLAADRITVHHLPVFDDADPVAQVAGDVSLEFVYDFIIDQRATAITRAIQAIAETEHDEGVLVHCTAGKDRTGLVIALTLTAVGVERELAVADYAATETHLAGEWAESMIAAVTSRGFELTTDSVALLTASPAPALERQLDRIEGQHGSVERYLLAHGLTDTHLDRLHQLLIDTDKEAS